MYGLATIWKIFSNSSLNLYQELYKNLPEITIAEKIIKLRKTHNLERHELADMLGLHFDTVIRWEQGVFPKPENVKLLGELFCIPIEYFHEYYSIYYSSYQGKIREWKDKNKYSYSMAAGILGVSHSGFARLLSGKVRLSYDMYLKLQSMDVF